MIDNLYQFREHLRQQGVYFSFMGPFSQSLMEDIIEVLKRRMQLENAKTSAIMQVFAIVVEQVQNIIHHSAETSSMKALGQDDPTCRVGTLVVGYNQDSYFVISGNMIENTQVEQLRDRLTKLHGMTKDELKQYYKVQLRRKSDPESRSTGLGLIDMARKTSKPLEFAFQRIDERVSFFSINAII
jgi:hypothetical protein